MKGVLASIENKSFLLKGLLSRCRVTVFRTWRYVVLFLLLFFSLFSESYLTWTDGPIRYVFQKIEFLFQDSETQWMVFLFLFVYLFLFIFLQTDSFKTSPRTMKTKLLWLTGLISIAVLQYAFAYQSSVQSRQALNLLSGAAFGQAAALLFKPRQVGNEVCNLRFFHLILVALLFIASLWRGAYAVEIFQYGGLTRWTGPWENPNLYGLLMALGMILIIGLGFQTMYSETYTTGGLSWKSWLGRGLKLALFLVPLCLITDGLIRSYSRGAWVAAGCGALYFTLEIKKSPHVQLLLKDSGLRRNWIPLLAIIVSLFVVTLWRYHHTENRIVKRVFSMSNSLDFSWRNRVSAWEGTLNMMADRPWFGWGWNRPEPMYENYYRPKNMEEGQAIQMNDFFMLGATLGLPALGCFAMYVGLVFFKNKHRSFLSVREINNKLEEEKPGKDLGKNSYKMELISSQAICRAGIIIMVVGFWFDGELFRMATATPFWILLELGRRNTGQAKMEDGEWTMEKTTAEQPTFNAQHRTLNTINIRRINFGLLGVPVLVIAVLLGGIVWAKSRDPFERIDFKLKTIQHGPTRGIVVLPKIAGPYPVVVYLYGSGGSLLTSGNSLRQMAELGIAAVTMEYNQTNREAFEEQFRALLDFIPRQSWARSNAIAWAGFSLGAQYSLRYLLRHQEVQPRLLVRISGGWVDELDETLGVESSNSQSLIRCPVLIVHGEKDEIFPAEDARRLAALLRTNGVSVTSKIFSDKEHGYGADRGLLIRELGEYCKAVLAPGEPFSGVTERWMIPFWVCMVSAGVWLLVWIYVKRKSSADQVNGAEVQLTKFDLGLRWVAGVLAVLAIVDTALHLVPPRMGVSKGTLDVARKYLVPSKEENEFEFLAEKPVWDGRKLKVLLEHAELASYNRQLINWKLEESVYRDYVVCPTIDSLPREELNWRRPLWESFYPRIRKENTPEAAAVIVVRLLRERVTIDLKRKWDGGVETIWKRGITDESGFEKIYVAALRSVGVGSRLDDQGKTEFWTGKEWKAAPRPLVNSLLAGK